LNQWSKPADFPVINPDFSGNKNKYVYAASSSGSRQTLPHFPFDMVVKLNLLDKSIHTWTVGARRFIGEPIFVPKGREEDDGYLLVVEVRNQSALKSLFPMFFRSITGKKNEIQDFCMCFNATLLHILAVLQYAVAIQRCYLVILNPKRIGKADALVARLEVPRHLNFPLGFHGFWANGS
jgi:9-cis-beta-carotene 9',10'-cleaving dioxygenase